MERDVHQPLYVEAPLFSQGAVIQAPAVHHHSLHPQFNEAKMGGTGPQQLHTSSTRTNCTDTAGLCPTRSEQMMLLWHAKFSRPTIIPLHLTITQGEDCGPERTALATHFELTED